MPTLTTDDLSRILDNVRLIEESKQDRPCTFAMVRTRYRLFLREPYAFDAKREDLPCGKTATHQVMYTCCDMRIEYRCAEHAIPRPMGPDRPSVCFKCKHMCWEGICYHRIITSL